MKASARMKWIVEQLGVQPADDVLEIGGGHGVAATLVLDRLGTGRFVGVDRSAKMLAAAKQRNAKAVGEGRAEFVLGEVPDVDVGNRRFDVVFAARVAAMSRPDGVVTAARLLKPGGALVLAFDSPDATRTRAAAATAVANLAGAGLLEDDATEAIINGDLVMCLRAVQDVAR